MEVKEPRKFYDRINERYAGEQRFMYYLSRGNMEKCLQYCKKGIEEFRSGKMNDIYYRYKDQLRAHKDAMIVLNTVCRVAARNGGVSPTIVNFLSHKYALSIEKADSVEMIVKRIWPMLIIEYCDMVRNCSSVAYSELTNQTIDYILDHLPEELTVQMIAEKLYVDPSFLSHKFKEETGETISGYINKNRVRLAQYYFEDGYKNISEVALLSGFSDGNYFSRIYKKITGTTPSSYIRHLKEKNQLF